MKLLFIPALFLTWQAGAKPIEPDSLLILIKNGKADEVVAHLDMSAPGNKAPATAFETRQMSVYVMALHATGDTLRANVARQRLLLAQLQQDKAREVIRFIFSSGAKFITQPKTYFYLQDLGFALSEKYREPRAQFSFLQQKFSMYQMTNQVHRLPDILNGMQSLGKDNPYLAFQTDLHYGLYYSGLQNDSCVYYFERYLGNARDWIGKENPNFLNDAVYAAKKDSSIMASSIMEYAKHYIRKGDLKKAGELLVTSIRLIPDTSSFAIIKIQNQLVLATIYSDLVNPSRALHYAREAVDLSEKFNLQRLRSTRVAAGYAYALMANGQFHEAQKELVLAYHEYPRGVNCQDPAKQVLRLALNSANQNDTGGSRMWLDTATFMRCESDPEMRFLESMAQGNVALLEKKYSLAQDHFSHAEVTARLAHAIGWRKEAIYRQYLCAKESKSINKSFTALEIYSHLNDSLYRSGQEVALFDIEAGYHKSLQDETIARLDAENIAASERLAAQRRTLLIIAGGLFLVSVLLLLMLRLYRQVKQSHAIISKAIEEKNILLREIHHRVKNNLQVISSLLKLQSNYIRDEAAVQAIAEGRSRVQSMALLHQNLYKEDNLTGVNMQEYFDNLIQGLFDTYNIARDRIRLHKNIAPINLDVDTVVPLGLITNELISNALKHAFSEGSYGNLYVDLYEADENLVLKIRDDGRGHAASGAQGFGSKLIQSLSQKLEADLSTRSENGTEVVLTVKEYRKAA